MSLHELYLEKHYESLGEHAIILANLEFSLEEQLAELEIAKQRKAELEAKLAYQESFRNRVKPFLWGLAVVGVIKLGAWIIERCL